MGTKILDGKWLAQATKMAIATQVKDLAAAGKRLPGLGVILVGDNPASHTYVKNKSIFAKDCGFATFDQKLPADSSQQEVAQAIKDFNEHPGVDGILLQLPLPAHLKAEPLLSLIDPAKDADGLHPLNQGLLMRGEGELRPCTPSGCMKLIDLALSNHAIGQGTLDPFQLPRADLGGKKAVVVGRSVLVGKPCALMLLERNATVTMAHSKTPDLPSVCREADILVAAIGRAEMITAEYIKPGALVIDVGMNRNSSGKLCGDVAFSSAVEVVSAITPVPGGVGPMTIAMLVHNTYTSWCKRHQRS